MFYIIVLLLSIGLSAVVGFLAGVKHADKARLVREAIKR